MYGPIEKLYAISPHIFTENLSYKPCSAVVCSVLFCPDMIVTAVDNYLFSTEYFISIQCCEKQGSWIPKFHCMGKSAGPIAWTLLLICRYYFIYMNYLLMSSDYEHSTQGLHFKMVTIFILLIPDNNIKRQLTCQLCNRKMSQTWNSVCNLKLLFSCTKYYKTWNYNYWFK
jgi:hypothetical protein